MDKSQATLKKIKNILNYSNFSLSIKNNEESYFQFTGSFDSEEISNSSIISNPNNSTDEILGIINTDEKEKEKEININSDENYSNQIINNESNILNSNIVFNPDSEINTGEIEDDERVSDVFAPSATKKRFLSNNNEKKGISPNEERRKKLKKRKKNCKKFK